MAYDDAASQAALAVAKSVLQDAVKAAGVVKVASQAMAAAVVGAEQAKSQTEQMLSSMADKSLSNVEADAVAALVGRFLFASTHSDPGTPATITLRPMAEGSTIYGMVLTVSA